MYTAVIIDACHQGQGPPIPAVAYDAPSFAALETSPDILLTSSNWNEGSFGTYFVDAFVQACREEPNASHTRLRDRMRSIIAHASEYGESWADAVQARGSPHVRFMKGGWAQPFGNSE